MVGPVIGRAYVNDDGNLIVKSIRKNFESFYEKIVKPGVLSASGKTKTKTGPSYLICESDRIPFRLELVK